MDYLLKQRYTGRFWFGPTRPRSNIQRTDYATFILRKCETKCNFSFRKLLVALRHLVSLWCLGLRRSLCCGLLCLIRWDIICGHWSGENHQKCSSVILHSSFYTVMDDIHEVYPMFLVFPGHASVAFVWDVVEGLTNTGSKQNNQVINEFRNINEQTKSRCILRTSSKKSKYTRFPCSSRTRKSPFSKPAEIVAMFIALDLLIVLFGK